MTSAQLLILQIIAHFIADFMFQSDSWARYKMRFGLWSKIMYRHIFIVFILSWLLSFQLKFIYASLLISIFHFFIDGFKVKIGNLHFRNIKPIKKIYFFIDQFLHLAIIWLFVFMYSKYFSLNPILPITISERHLIIILGYLFCQKPTNIIIREIFKIYNIKLLKQTTKDLSDAGNTEDLSDAGNTEDLLDAGKMIGSIERVIAFTLVLIGQYQAIGFIIAGKSILRYEGKKTSKTEYVLIGTLLSFGIAILTGIAIIKLNIQT